MTTQSGSDIEHVSGRALYRKISTIPLAAEPSANVAAVPTTEAQQASDEDKERVKAEKTAAMFSSSSSSTTSTSTSRLSFSLRPDLLHSPSPPSGRRILGGAAALELAMVTCRPVKAGENFHLLPQGDDEEDEEEEEEEEEDDDDD